MSILLMTLVTFITAFILTGLMRAYALKKNIIDNPNERSSHTIPTPRGGGMAIVVTYLSVLIILLCLDYFSITIGLTLIGAGLAIAVLGFLDDHGHINSMIRLLIHFIIAGSIVFALGGFSETVLFNGHVSLGWFANIIAILFLVWLLNLYNFMDGINGIASIEAITTVFSIGVIYWGLNTELVYQPLLLLAASVFGFMLWNFPKAKIFMGDAGSGFLGLILGIFALIALKHSAALFCAWIICLGVFIVDATFTLIRRVLNGQKMYDAHRSHAYQHAAQKYKGHTATSLAVCLINLVWLFPMAYLASQNDWMPELVLLIAYIPLIVLVVYYKAGKADYDQ